ncbi:FAD-dependent oxidoreductase [Pedobacter yulinensis]|uniref:FAD-dependent oxidoreductase n=1 Tax=Pedobacter yulinensis TaxID=2126353 RepID=A0A2T3HJ31_9SPHI|nr:glycerol-3-phosphate dehydrogenase/oxidase [Pedobacter yulinensis]PST82442.1 FAD-dependent oxidoreductase [Pedobacter yulinensis]
MKRNHPLDLSGSASCDILIIGGGATGLGIAVDAASRGLKTILIEQSDFAKGTSSRSTKLVHGGVRYLAQGDIKLVYSALHERGMLQKNAPHLVKKEAFIIPCYSWFAIAKYLVGLKFYDMLAGKYTFGKSEFLSAKEVSSLLPGIKTKGLKGGIRYFDGKFDDARLALNLAQTASEKGARLATYVKATGLLKDTAGKVAGAEVADLITGETYPIRAKSVINATGVFVNDILNMNSPNAPKLVRPSQGVHVVLDKRFLESEVALMIPETSDGRVLFAVPWHGHLLVGTTDTPLNDSDLEPRALPEEVNFILNTAAAYFNIQPKEGDILSVFSGLRPLAAPSDKDGSSTKEISRDHKLIVSDSGLITITGGKWTTYRKMAEETVDLAIKNHQLAAGPCVTRSLPVHGAAEPREEDHLSVYGSDKAHIEQLLRERPELAQTIHPAYPYTLAEVEWICRNEQAETVEDVLSRRLRVLFFDAAAAIEMAAPVAALMGKLFDRDEHWQKSQAEAFSKLAEGYLYKKSALRHEQHLYN